MGPGIAVKAVMLDKFSLVTYGCAQIVMDMQPLVVMLTNRGDIHGWTHTFVAALGLGALAALIGKYLTPWLLHLLTFGRHARMVVPWRVAILSALVGTLSHVLLDAFVHPDVKPFWPFTRANPLDFGITMNGMINFCIISGGIGLVVYLIRWVVKKSRKSDSHAVK
jgi:membrane-bound metal-dependent hydrolase YbcI (DUF457 family)